LLDIADTVMQINETKTDRLTERVTSLVASTCVVWRRPPAMRPAPGRSARTPSYRDSAPPPTGSPALARYFRARASTFQAVI
jgi:hypothetical protein